MAVFFDDGGSDSLDTVEVAMASKEAFGREVSPEEMESIIRNSARRENTLIGSNGAGKTGA